MSSKSETDLEQLSREIAELEAQRDIEANFYRKLGLTHSEATRDFGRGLDKSAAKVEELNEEIESKRQRFISIELKELLKANQAVKESVEALNDSAKSQLETTENLLHASNEQSDLTKRMTKSSIRLENLSSFLILFTIILALLAALTDAVNLVTNSSVSEAVMHQYLIDLSYALLGTLGLFVGLSLFVFFYQRRTNRRTNE